LSFTKNTANFARFGLACIPPNDVDIQTNFDVYMLGKVLWCMVAGKPKLDREFWDEQGNDVTKLFPTDPNMYMINDLLGHSVVVRENSCLSSANDLLLVVDTHLETIKHGGQLLRDAPSQ
jgi:hypothetical protein